jgi:hypothetical protein
MAHERAGTEMVALLTRTVSIFLLESKWIIL